MRGARRYVGLCYPFDRSTDILQNVLCSRLLASHSVQRSGIPADLPRYLEKLMRVIHQFPIAEPLHAMREIVAQQTAGVLELVSQNVLADFINTCKRLTKDSPSHWHEAAIISINISSAVCDEVFFKAPGYPKDMANPTCSDVLCEWACKLLRHFDGLKAPRVLHSIGTSALVAEPGHANSTLHQSLE